jgi:hypothetical protein
MPPVPSTTTTTAPPALPIDLTALRAAALNSKKRKRATLNDASGTTSREEGEIEEGEISDGDGSQLSAIPVHAPVRKAQVSSKSIPSASGSNPSGQSTKPRVQQPSIAASSSTPPTPSNLPPLEKLIRIVSPPSPATTFWAQPNYSSIKGRPSPIPPTPVKSQPAEPSPKNALPRQPKPKHQKISNSTSIPSSAGSSNTPGAPSVPITVEQKSLPALPSKPAVSLSTPSSPFSSQTIPLQAISVPQNPPGE